MVDFTDTKASVSFRASYQRTGGSELAEPGKESSTTVCQKVASFHYFSKLK